MTATEAESKSQARGARIAQKKLLIVAPPSGAGPGAAGIENDRVLSHLAAGFSATVVVPTPEIRSYEWVHGRDDKPYREIFFSLCGERKSMLRALSDLLKELVEEEHPEAIALFNPGLFAGCVAMTSRWLDLRLLLFCDGSEIESEIFGDSGPDIRYALENAHAVFVPTRSAAHKASKLAPGARIHRVENAIELQTLAYCQEFAGHPHPKVGLFSERIQSRDLHFLLDNLDFDIFNLKIAGAIPESEAGVIRAALERRPELKTKVEFTHLPSDPLARLIEIEDVDIVCSPSLHSGIPRMVLEAMSVGRLVVASQTGGPAEILQHGQNGFLFRHGDADEMGAALCDALMCLRTDRHDGIRQAARATVEADHCVQLERDLYLALVAEALGEETALSDFEDNSNKAELANAHAPRAPSIAQIAAAPAAPQPTISTQSALAQAAIESAAQLASLESAANSATSLESDEDIETSDLDDESFVFKPLQSFADALGQP